METTTSTRFDNKARYFALAFVLFIATAIAILATDNDYTRYEAGLVHITIEGGDVNVTPSDIESTITINDDGTIRVKVLANVNPSDIVVSLPAGWGYEFYEAFYEAKVVYHQHHHQQFEAYDIYRSYEPSYEAYSAYYCVYAQDETDELEEDDSNQYNPIIIVLTPAANESDLDGEYVDYHTEYGGYYYSPSNLYSYYVDSGQIEGYGSYIDFMPFGAGRVVTFNPNGGITPAGQGYRQTDGTGTLGSSSNWPNPPSFGGRVFMWWSICQHGRDPAVTAYADRFSYDTYIPLGGLTVYAVWGFVVEFNGNGHLFPLPLPQLPSNPNAYVDRIIPNTWCFDEAEAFGLPVTFPVTPYRGGFQFWGWYNIRIPNQNIEVPAPAPAISVNRYTIITQPMEFSPRWRLHTHLVMFDMNDTQTGVTGTAQLNVGTAANPQRLYRWVLNNRSIADSGLGGNNTTGIGLPSGTVVDGAPNVAPQEWYRQNMQQTWTPNFPSGDASHIPRWITPPGFLTPIGNPNFTTPYYTNSGLVRGTAAGVIGDANGDAGTSWPRAAPSVSMPDTWTPFPAATSGTNATARTRYTLEGWWTTPDGWTQNAPGSIVSERFAPAGFNAGHTTAEVTTTTSFPQGFPTGLARPAAGTATGRVTEDMTVYGLWVYRLTFHLNGGGSHGVQPFSVAGAANFDPGSSNTLNFRDILPSLPEAERTINQNGRRIRQNTGAGSVIHQPVPAGMPAYSAPTRVNHIFNGWWDRPIAPISHIHLDTCTMGCITYFCYPAVHLGATRITGDTIINGNMTAYAHWRNIPFERTDVYVRFHLNAPLASATTNHVHGNSYWPTGRPNIAGYTNPNERYFLNRLATGTAGIPGLGMPPSIPSLAEAGQPGTVVTRHFVGAVTASNIYYGDRYEPFIERRRYLGYSLVNTANPTDHRLPRAPMRTGYVFVGWSLSPNTPALAENGLPTVISAAANPTPTPGSYPIFNTGTVLSYATLGLNPGDTLNLHAVWAPAFDLILDGNDGTTSAPVRTQIIRQMPYGFTSGDMDQASRGGGTAANGTTHQAGKYSVTTWRTTFSRTGFVQIGPTNAYNTHQPAQVGHGTQITNAVRFNTAFFNAFPANNIQPNPTGNDYLRVYLQWGGSITFNSNHSLINSGFTNTTRVANIAYGQTFNMALDHNQRHMHQPLRSDVFGTHGNTQSNWFGTQTATGTRGGWPRDPFIENPPRVTDASHGDWFNLFNVARQNGFTLQGWHRNADGVCTPNMTWVTPDTVIEGNIVIFAIWRQGVVFAPGVGGNEVDMSGVGPSPADWYRPVVPGQVLPNFPSPPPTWPGRNFVGWYAVPVPGLPRPPSIAADTLVFSSGRFYAVFEAPVRFNPTGPPSSPVGSGGEWRITGTPPHTNSLNRNELIGDYASLLPHERLYRPGWGYFDQNSRQWFAIDPEGENDRRIYTPFQGAHGNPGDPDFRPATAGDRTVWQETDLFPMWLSAFTFKPGHTRGRLDTPPVSTNVIRNVPEGLTLNTNIADQRTPAVTYSTDPAWPNDPGIYFAGWRRLSRTVVGGNPVYTPVNPDGTPVAAGATPQLMTAAQINAIVAASPGYFFEAVWGLCLEFFKVGETVSDPPHRLGFNPLYDGRFILQREVPASGGGTQWVQAYPLTYVAGTGWQTPSPNNFIASDVNGRVFINSATAPGQPFNHLLELNPSTPTEFRLIETQAPGGYRTPPGFWHISVSNQAGPRPTITAHDNNPAPLPEAVGEADTPYEGHRWLRLPNIPYEFYFWKVDNTGARLPNAEFRLFVYNGDNPPALNIITQSMIGPGANQWSEAGAPQISSPTNAMVFRIRPGRHYQLAEIVAPQGFQLPIGQWRITATTAVMPAYPTLYPNIIPIGGGAHMPAITQTRDNANAIIPETYSVLNLRDTTLPLTGGIGVGSQVQTFAMAGASVLAIAALSAGVIVLRKRKRTVTTAAE